MYKVIFNIFFLVGFNTALNAQELFPQSEPASNISKEVLGIRMVNEGYQEINQFRTQQSLRLMFGITSKWMITGSLILSNRHDSILSSDFFTDGIKKGKKYQYQAGCVNINVKYRFFSLDGEKSHFRMAAYFERADDKQPHIQAEPSLMLGNGGTGGGLIITKLHQRFAISTTIGGIFPNKYSSEKNDSLIEIKYGKALNYSLSLGFLCLPVKYKNYKQLNVNVYAEFIGKSYNQANIYVNGEKKSIDHIPELKKGNYIELRPSVQFIFNSNLRIDLSIATPFINRSFLRNYPIYYLSIQRYIYFN